jgi:four helix bundle protein
VTERIVVHNDLEVYRHAFEAAMRIFESSRSFPKEETYSLTDQLRRSSRAVCANLAEAWRKRRDEKHFITALAGAESEAAETQVWLEFATKCGYLEASEARELYRAYHGIIAAIVGMINHPETWILDRGANPTSAQDHPSEEQRSGQI